MDLLFVPSYVLHYFVHLHHQLSWAIHHQLHQQNVHLLSMIYLVQFLQNSIAYLLIGSNTKGYFLSIPFLLLLVFYELYNCCNYGGGWHLIVRAQAHYNTHNVIYII